MRSGEARVYAFDAFGLDSKRISCDDPAVPRRSAQMSMNIMKDASEASDGTYAIRTQGLHAHRHAELEIVGIPRPAVEAAAKLIDYVIEVVIERKGAQLKHNQNVGFPLTIEGHEDVPPVFVGVRAVQAEPAAGGFFARMRGTAKGVLRLADLFDSKTDVPLTAVATLMLYRANCRVVTDDIPGAVVELKAAIEMMPGGASATRMPSFDTGDARFNWQNHLAYLRLSELLTDENERASILGRTYAQFEWLAMDEFGATVGELAKLGEEDLLEEAKRILQTNLENPMLVPGPHEGLRSVGSPIWTPGAEGTSVRAASLIPAGFVDYYYGVELKKDDIRQAVAEIAAAGVFLHRAGPWRLLEMTENARGLYKGVDSPVAAAAADRHPAHTLLSAVMAEASRYLRAGASLDEIRAAFGLDANDPGNLAEGLAQKVAILEAWETEQYVRAIGGGTAV